MTKKTYTIAVAGMLFLLALYLFLTDVYYTIFGLTGILILAVVLFLGLYFLFFGNKSWILHIFAGLALIYNILYATIYSAYYDLDLIALLLTCFLALAYLLAQFLLQEKKKAPDNDKFYLLGVILFSILAAGLCTFGGGAISFSLNLFTLFAVLLFLIYFLLYSLIPLKSPAAYIVIGCDAILTIVRLCMITAFGSQTSTLRFCGILLIWLLALGGYILFDIMSRSDTESKFGTAPVSTKNHPNAVSFEAKVKKVEDLQTLRENGILSEEEFQAQKNKILGGNNHV